LDLKVPPSWRDLGRGKKMEDKTGLRAKTKFFNMKPPCLKAQTIMKIIS